MPAVVKKRYMELLREGYKGQQPLVLSACRRAWGSLQPVDGVGADPQQAGTGGIDPGDRAGPLEDVLGIVHPRMDRRVPAAMRSR